MSEKLAQLKVLQAKSAAQRMLRSALIGVEAHNARATSVDQARQDYFFADTEFAIDDPRPIKDPKPKPKPINDPKPGQKPKPDYVFRSAATPEPYVFVYKKKYYCESSVLTSRSDDPKNHESIR